MGTAAQKATSATATASPPPAAPPTSPPAPRPVPRTRLEAAEAEVAAAELNLTTARAVVERVAGPPRSTGALAEQRAEAVRLATQRLADARRLVDVLHRRAAGVRADLEEAEAAAASHEADARAATERAGASRAHAAELRARLVGIMGDRPLPDLRPGASPDAEGSR